MAKVVLLLVCLPLVLVTWPIGLLTIALGLSHSPRWEAFGVLSLEWRPWFAKRFGYAFTFGRTIFYYPGGRDEDAAVDTETERHEHVHVRQIEDTMFCGLVVGLVVGLLAGWLLGLCVWVSSGLWIVLNYVTALLRYGPTAKTPEGETRWYFNAEHEFAAYAQTDVLKQLGMSWQELRERAAARAEERERQSRGNAVRPPPPQPQGKA